MLTKRQKDLLMFIHEQIKVHGVAPSYDEMRHHLGLKSKSGINRMVVALEERGFISRRPHVERAICVLRLPDHATTNAPSAPIGPSLVYAAPVPAADSVSVLGRIAAGVPIEALQHETHRASSPVPLPAEYEHYALEVRGDSMIEEGILEGDLVILKRTEMCSTGDIVVAVIDDEEATLTRLRKKGRSIALGGTKTRIFSPDRVRVQGVMVALVRHYEDSTERERRGGE